MSAPTPDELRELLRKEKAGCVCAACGITPVCFLNGIAFCAVHEERVMGHGEPKVSAGGALMRRIDFRPSGDYDAVDIPRLLNYS